MTKLENLINPEVMGAFLDKKIVDMIKFAPLAAMGYELQGQAGNTLTIPTWGYIGDAKDLGEGVKGSVEQLTATTSQVTVKKAVKNVSITDEARLSGYGDPMGQIEVQLATSIAQKVDGDVLAGMKSVTALTHTGEMSINLVADALVAFGEDLDEATVLLVNAKNYGELRKSPEFVHVANGEKIMTGQVGTVYGVGIVVTNKLTDAEAFLVRAGAIGIEVKREVAVEVERDVLTKSTIVSADRHYIAYVRDANRIVKLTVAAGETPAVTRKATK